MIKVTVGNNMIRKTDLISENATLAEAIAKSGIDLSGRTVQLNGEVVSSSDMGKSFAELGVTSEAFLLTVAKLENA